MAVTFLDLTDGYYTIIFKENSSSENMQLWYENGLPKQFATSTEATEFAVENLGTKEFYLALNTEPVVTVP